MANVRPALLFAVLCVIGAVVTSTDIIVRGPEEVLTGDYEMFTCQIVGDDVNANYNYSWKYQFSDGTTKVLDKTDMLSSLEMKSENRGELIVTSFLRARPEVTQISCEHSPTVSSSKPILVKDLTPVAPQSNLCQEAEDAKAPITTLFLTSNNLINPSYRIAHYLMKKPLEISSKGNEMRLECYSPTSAPPKWIVNQEMISKMKYASWVENTNSACKKQVFHIYQIAGDPGSVFSLNMDCVAESYKSSVQLNIEIPMTRSGGMDFNSTENCIDGVVNSFYTRELTGVGVGSSAAIVLLMVGMAVLKRQLNQQKNINRDQQRQNHGATGVEDLNPSQFA